MYPLPELEKLMLSDSLHPRHELSLLEVVKISDHVQVMKEKVSSV